MSRWRTRWRLLGGVWSIASARLDGRELTPPLWGRVFEVGGHWFWEVGGFGGHSRATHGCRTALSAKHRASLYLQNRARELARAEEPPDAA